VHGLKGVVPQVGERQHCSEVRSEGDSTPNCSSGPGPKRNMPSKIRHVPKIRKALERKDKADLLCIFGQNAEKGLILI